MPRRVEQWVDGPPEFRLNADDDGDWNDNITSPQHAPPTAEADVIGTLAEIKEEDSFECPSSSPAAIETSNHHDFSLVATISNEIKPPSKDEVVMRPSSQLRAPTNINDRQYTVADVHQSADGDHDEVVETAVTADVHNGLDPVEIRRTLIDYVEQQSVERRSSSGRTKLNEANEIVVSAGVHRSPDSPVVVDSGHRTSTDFVELRQQEDVSGKTNSIPDPIKSQRIATDSAEKFFVDRPEASFSGRTKLDVTKIPVAADIYNSLDSTAVADSGHRTSTDFVELRRETASGRTNSSSDSAESRRMSANSVEQPSVERRQALSSGQTKLDVTDILVTADIRNSLDFPVIADSGRRTSTDSVELWRRETTSGRTNKSSDPVENGRMTADLAEQRKTFGSGRTKLDVREIALTDVHRSSPENAVVADSGHTTSTDSVELRRRETVCSSGRTKLDVEALLLANRESIYELQLDEELEAGSRESLLQLICGSDDDWSTCGTEPRKPSSKCRESDRSYFYE